MFLRKHFKLKADFFSKVRIEESIKKCIGQTLSSAVIFFCVCVSYT